MSGQNVFTYGLTHRETQLEELKGAQTAAPLLKKKDTVEVIQIYKRNYLKTPSCGGILGTFNWEATQGQTQKRGGIFQLLLGSARSWKM